MPARAVHGKAIACLCVCLSANAAFGQAIINGTAFANVINAGARNPGQMVNAGVVRAFDNSYVTEQASLEPSPRETLRLEVETIIFEQLTATFYYFVNLILERAGFDPITPPTDSGDDTTNGNTDGTDSTDGTDPTDDASTDGRRPDKPGTRSSSMNFDVASTNGSFESMADEPSIGSSYCKCPAPYGARIKYDYCSGSNIRFCTGYDCSFRPLGSTSYRVVSCTIEEQR